MPARTIVITGTDTGVGKTHAACALIHAWRTQGLSVCGFKPVASGCTWDSGANRWRNDDALALAQASASHEPYETINPYAFEPPIAPHLAARRAGTHVEIAALDAAHDALASRHDRVVLEGAGGWLVPLNEAGTFADWVGSRGWPVILVVGLRLGCINHALLSAEAITRRTRFAGWIANGLPPPQDGWEDVVEALRRRLAAPLLGCLPEGLPPAAAAARLSVDGV